jgi:cell division protein FtsZ
LVYNPNVSIINYKVMAKKVTPEVESFARIKVIGVGGSGGNAVNHMLNSNVKGVEFISVNTDAQDLHHSQAKKKIHIGKNLTKGLGTGMNPELGKRAAEETKEEIQEVLKGADMVFIAGGMGGGTGTGASPIIARTAKELGALTVGVVTKPFFFEGSQRMSLADHGLNELRNEVDALIVIPNDRLLNAIDKDTTAKSAFAMCDEVLREAVEGISDLITNPGLINVDFADIRAIMENAGSALMGVGRASGEKRSEEAAKLAISSPLLDLSIHGAKGILFAIAGGDDLTMNEIQEAAKIITESIDGNAKVIFGAVYDTKLKKNEVKITVIASGFPSGALPPTAERGIFSNPLKSTTPMPGKPTPSQSKAEEEEEAEVGKIYNSIDFLKNSNKEKDNKKKTPPAKVVNPPQPKKGAETKEKDDDDDDDDWGAVPAFLRRGRR